MIEENNKLIQVGDIVTVTEFESNDEMSFVEPMRYVIGTQWPVQRIDSVDPDCYYVAGWAWPKSALTKVTVNQQTS